MTDKKIRGNYEGFCQLLLILHYCMHILAGCKKIPENGVSLQLAKERKELLSNIEYSLHFSIPENKSEKITGKADIGLMLSKRDEIVIDFRENASNIKKVSIDDKNIDISS